jgi:hypothetical protein
MNDDRMNDGVMNDSLLTLIAPAHMQDAIVELLLDHPELAPGFTVSGAEGHGAGSNYPSLAEQVRGRDRKLRVDCALPRAHARALVALVGARLPRRDIVYWITPILEFGTC